MKSKGSYDYEMLEQNGVTWGRDTKEAFSITKIVPDNYTDDDKKYLGQMFNSIVNATTIKDQL